jgi:hypothetical protein
MRPLRRLPIALALACSALGAAAQGPVSHPPPPPPEPPPTSAAASGPGLALPHEERVYLVGAAGRNQYDYDCWFWADCARAGSTVAKLGIGVRLGPLAIEGWYTDFGRASLDRPGEQLRLRTFGLGGAWYVPLSPQLEGLLRAGIANYRHERTGDYATQSYTGTLGMGLLVTLAQGIALELAWDLASAEGAYTGTTLANALTVGLRARFH